MNIKPVTITEFETNLGDIVKISIDRYNCFLDVNGAVDMLSTDDVRAFLKYVPIANGWNHQGSVIALDSLNLSRFVKAMKTAKAFMCLNAQVSA